MEVKEVREKLMLSQTELGDILGVNWKTISRWERGESKVKIVYQRELEKMVNEQELEEQITPRMIKAIRESNGLTQEEFAKKLGTYGKTISAWETGKTEPRSWLKRKIYKFYLEHRGD